MNHTPPRSSPALSWDSAWWLALLIIPWLNPWAKGPSSSVQPWLVSAVCAFLLALSRGHLRAPIGVVALLGALCGLAAVQRGITLDVLALFGAVLVMLACASAAAANNREPQFVRVVAVALLAAATASSLIALCQYFGLASAFDPWISPSAVGEAYANLRQRNQFASLTSIGLAALLWLSSRGLHRRIALILIVLLAAGNAASASRTGAVQWMLLMGLAIFTARQRGAMAALCSVGFVALGASAVGLPALLEWATGTQGPSLFMRFVGSAGCSGRFILWSNVVDLIALKPWFGWGWGELDFAHYMTLYSGDRFCDILDNAHSLPLHLAVEAGLPVAILVTGALLWLMGHFAPVPGRERGAGQELAWPVMAVILLHSLLEYPLWYGPFQITFGLCLGLLWPAPAPADNAVAQEGHRAMWLRPAWLAIPALAAVAYAAWDYRRISQIYLPAEARAAAYADDTLGKARASWLFQAQVSFAELTLTPLTRENAPWTYETASRALHYSPEPRVIEKVIDSALALGREQEAIAHLRRFQAAFPDSYAAWRATNGLPPSSAAVRN